MDKKLILGIIPVILLLTATTVFGVTNGGFETPIVTATQGWDIYDDGTAELEWTVEWYSTQTSYGGQTRPDPAHLELHRGVNNWDPYEGYQYAELDTDWDGPGGGLSGEPASVKISQEIDTTSGCEYELTYYWSPRPNHNDNQMKVYINDDKVGDHSGTGGSNTNWHEEIVQFTANSDTTTISFIETGDPDSLGMFLDNVIVEEIECPEMCVVEDVVIGLTEPDLDVPDVRLGTNRWVFDGEDWVTTQPNGKGWDKSFSIEDTYGCNCEQILTWLHENYPEEYGEMKGHWKFGCSISVLEDFITLAD